jgi:hypothetical protein
MNKVLNLIKKNKKSHQSLWCDFYSKIKISEQKFLLPFAITIFLATLIPQKLSHHLATVPHHSQE